MSSLKINKVVPTSFAKVFSLYSLFIAVIMSVIDLILWLVSGVSSFVGEGTFGAWIVYVIIFIILSPVLGYIFGLIMSFILNLALKAANGFDLEIQ